MLKMLEKFVMPVNEKMQPFRIRRPRTAFVFAGGGSMGAVQVGMLRALVEEGIEADLVVGSSVGAINAAYFAGMPSMEGIETLETLWRGIKRHDVFPVTWRGLLGFLMERRHVVPADGLRRLIGKHLPFANLEDAEIALRVVATDARTGEAAVLAKGPATEAILASTAIPGAFAPVEFAGRTLCDGGIASNTPVAAAVAAGAERLIVLPSGFAPASNAPPRGAIECALHAVTLMTTRQLASEMAVIGAHINTHVLPAACPKRLSPFDFSETATLIEHAYNSAKEWLDQGGLLQSAGSRISVPSISAPSRKFFPVAGTVSALRSYRDDCGPAIAVPA